MNSDIKRRARTASTTVLLSDMISNTLSSLDINIITYRGLREELFFHEKINFYIQHVIHGMCRRYIVREMITDKHNGICYRQNKSYPSYSLTMNFLYLYIFTI